MESFLTKKFFEQNRANLCQAVDHRPIVIVSNGLVQRTADTTFPFVQDSTFWYFTGLSIPDAILVIDETETYLIIPERSTSRAAFDGAIAIDELSNRSGIKTVYGEKAGWKKLKHSVSSAHLVATLNAPRKYNELHGFYANPARQQFIEQLTQCNPDVEVWSVAKEVSALRSIKQSEEIACIERAVAITKNAIETVVSDPVFRATDFEYQLEAALGAEFRKHGAAGHAYSPIVAAGAHATTLHYIANDGRVRPNDYIVMDVGAEVEHYAADITRTVIQGKPTARQRAVHIAVQAIQHDTIACMKPGAQLKHIEKQVEQLIGKELKSLGLITSAKDVDAVRRYYPHAVSHFLGLDVHDVGDYRAPLTPGMILTCEPGIYIPEEGIGVRIEDDILITDTGNRVL